MFKYSLTASKVSVDFHCLQLISFNLISLNAKSYYQYGIDSTLALLIAYKIESVCFGDNL